ncbi:hypothetical protein [Tardiphaga sp.]
MAVKEQASELSKRRHDRGRKAPEEAPGQPAMIVDNDAKRMLVQI